MSEPQETPPVLDGLESFPWSSHESVAYEAALEAINGVVGAYSAKIAAEKSKAAPDEQVIETARAGRAECARWRAQLDPADPDAVAETRRRFTQLAAEIREGSR